ncbi:MAG: hypothetical protein ACLS36_05480 [Streptococcus sp.]
MEQTSTWDQDSFTYDVVEVPVVDASMQINVKLVDLKFAQTFQKWKIQ